MEDSFGNFDLGDLDLPLLGFEPDSPACDSPAAAASVPSVGDFRTFSAGSASELPSLPASVPCPGSQGSSPPGELRSTRFRSLGRSCAIENQQRCRLVRAQVFQPRTFLKTNGPVRQCLWGTPLGSR